MDVESSPVSTDRLRAYCHDHPAFQEFAKNAELTLAVEPQESFFALSTSLNKLAFQSDFVSDIALRHLRFICDVSNHESRTWEDSNIVLSSHKNWELRLGLYSRQSPHIYTLPFNLLIAVVSRAPLHAAVYEIPGNMQNEIFDRHCYLGQPSSLAIHYGETFALHSCRSIFDPSPQFPVVALKLAGPISQCLQWAFDRQSGQAVQAIAANGRDSELVTVLQTLAALGDMDTAPIVATLTTHPRHFVRWAALQALAKLNPTLALSALKDSVTDKHPHVAKAAKRAVGQLGLTSDYQ